MAMPPQQSLMTGFDVEIGDLQVVDDSQKIDNHDSLYQTVCTNKVWVMLHIFFSVVLFATMLNWGETTAIICPDGAGRGANNVSKVSNDLLYAISEMDNDNTINGVTEMGINAALGVIRPESEAEAQEIGNIIEDEVQDAVANVADFLAVAADEDSNLNKQLGKAAHQIEHMIKEGSSFRKEFNKLALGTQGIAEELMQAADAVNAQDALKHNQGQRRHAIA